MPLFSLFRVPAMLGLLAVAACGGDSDDDAGEEASTDTRRSGDVVDPPPPGQSLVSLDGKQFSFNQPGAIACSVGDDSFSFSFRIGDNETTLGGGGARSGDLWSGEIRMTVGNPVGERGPIDYFVSLPEIDHSSLAFDGDSMSYTGPVKKQPPQDGSNPAAVDIGEGTISVTCP